MINYSHCHLRCCFHQKTRASTPQALKSLADLFLNNIKDNLYICYVWVFKDDKN
jgi:hypothetical protein